MKVIEGYFLWGKDLENYKYGGIERKIKKTDKVLKSSSRLKKLGGFK